MKLDIGFQRLASVLGTIRSRIVAMPSPEQRILSSLDRRPSKARELAGEIRLPLKEVYLLLGNLYERRAVSTRPDGYFWVGDQELPLDRSIEFRSGRSQSQDVGLSEASALSA